MDLGTATTLETQLRSMMDSVDELNQESIKFNKHQNLMLKQFQEKTRFIQKRQLENQARIARGEEPLPEEDMSKLFKNVAAPSRLNPLILSGTISFTADEVRFLALAAAAPAEYLIVIPLVTMLFQVSEFCSQSLAKLFLTEPLQNSKISLGQAASNV